MFCFATILLIILAQKTIAVEKCNTNCINYIKLKTDELAINITLKLTPIRLKVYPDYYQVYVLRRNLYRHISKHSEGKGATVELFDGPYLPDEIESDEWVKRNQCKIGSICIPEGDCYGDGLRHCENLGLNPQWVKSRDYKFKGAVWTNSFIFLKQRCVQDWECFIYKKSSIVYIDEKGLPFVKPGKINVYINSTNYIIDNGFIIYNKAAVEHDYINIDAKCIMFNGEKTCNFIFNDRHYSFSLKNEKCTAVRNFYVCMYNRNKRDLSPDTIVTIDDVKLLSHEVSNFMSVYNYNNMLLQKEILGIKSLLNKIILSVSRYNPFILKDILGLNVHARKTGNTIQACSCKDLDSDCVLNHKVYSGDSKCSPNGNIKTLDILHLEQIENIIPDSLDMRGKEETIFENEIEREMAQTEHFVNPNEQYGGSPLSFLNSFPGSWMFQGVAQFLPFVNTLLIFFFRH